MTRNPTTPCAACGRVLWSVSASRPPAERLCRSCRSSINTEWPRVRTRHTTTTTRHTIWGPCPGCHSWQVDAPDLAPPERRTLLEDAVREHVTDCEGYATTQDPPPDPAAATSSTHRHLSAVAP